jgi:hypothetical protein
MNRLEQVAFAADTTAAQTPTDSAEEQPIQDSVSPQPIPMDATPEEFYAAITKRADVRAILSALADS